MSKSIDSNYSLLTVIEQQILETEKKEIIKKIILLKWELRNKNLERDYFLNIKTK